MGEPVFLALLTADRVITEKNEKKGIIGTFNRLGSPRFPATFPPWWIYASATNLVGDHTFSLDILGDDGERKIFSANGKIRIGSPGHIIEIAVPVVGCSFPGAGSYTVFFHLDESQLGARVLRVDEITLPKRPAGSTTPETPDDADISDPSDTADDSSFDADKAGEQP
jgi:hypothetical protein